jgi:hypothetical protein
MWPACLYLIHGLVGRDVWLIMNHFRHSGRQLSHLSSQLTEFSLLPVGGQNCLLLQILRSLLFSPPRRSTRNSFVLSKEPFRQAPEYARELNFFFRHSCTLPMAPQAYPVFFTILPSSSPPTGQNLSIASNTASSWAGAILFASEFGGLTKCCIWSANTNG